MILNMNIINSNKELIIIFINFLGICFIYHIYKFILKKWTFSQKLKYLVDPSFKVSNSIKKNYFLLLRRDNLLQDKYRKYVRKNNLADFSLKNKLYYAGISTSANYIIYPLGLVSILMCFLINVFFNASFIFSLLFSTGIILALFSVYIGKQTQKRKSEINHLLPQALDIIIRGLKAGFSIEKTFVTVSHEIPRPIGNEFLKICEHISFGMTFEDAIRNAATRLNNSDFDFFVSAMIIQRRIGGSLAELVTTIVESLRKREDLRLKVKIVSSEAITTGLIVGSLPFLTTAFMWFINHQYLNAFIYNSVGHILLSIVAVLIVTAVFIVKWLIRFDL